MAGNKSNRALYGPRSAPAGTTRDPYGPQSAARPLTGPPRCAPCPEAPSEPQRCLQKRTNASFRREGCYWALLLAVQTTTTPTGVVRALRHGGVPHVTVRGGQGCGLASPSLPGPCKNEQIPVLQRGLAGRSFPAHGPRQGARRGCGSATTARGRAARVFLWPAWVCSGCGKPRKALQKRTNAGTSAR